MFAGRIERRFQRSREGHERSGEASGPSPGTLPLRPCFHSRKSWTVRDFEACRW